MVVYADSSFLLSVYLDDDHAPRAHHYLRHNPHPPYLTAFSKSEVEHALRLLAFRKVITTETMSRNLLAFERDQQEGFYEMVSIEAGNLFARTAELSHRHALESGVRYLDMLHLATALLLKAPRFLSFDDRQRKLGKALGLEVKP